MDEVEEEEGYGVLTETISLVPERGSDIDSNERLSEKEMKPKINQADTYHVRT